MESKKAKVTTRPDLPSKAFHWCGEFANIITLEDGSWNCSLAVRSNHEDDSSYFQFMARGEDKKDQMCLLCQKRQVYSTDQPSSMIAHIRSCHPECIPFEDMVKFNNNFVTSKISEWDAIEKNKKLSKQKKLVVGQILF